MCSKCVHLDKIKDVTTINYLLIPNDRLFLNRDLTFHVNVSDRLEIFFFQQALLDFGWEVLGGFKDTEYSLSLIERGGSGTPGNVVKDRRLNKLIIQSIQNKYLN